MLKTLSISNFAVVRSLQIDFNGGLNVLTGETGAGKSIIIDAINVVLGNRISKSIIRSGAEKASVEALFEADSNAAKLCADAGYETENGELLLSKEFSADGKSKVRINGRMATNGILKEIGEALINIHGQHDNQALMKKDRHINILDEYAGAGELLAEYRKLYAEMKGLKSELAGIDTDERERERTISILKYEIEEIEKAELKDGEYEELIAKREVIRNSFEILSNMEKACAVLNEGGEDYPSASELMNDAIKSLGRAAVYDERLVAVQNKLNEAYYLALDAAGELEALKDSLDFNEEDAEFVEKRIDEINSLRRKYGADYESIMEYYNTAAAKLDVLDKYEINRAGLRERLNTLEAELKKKAAELTDLRLKKSKILEKTVIGELNDLNMANSEFEVKLTRRETYNENGLDDVEFLISANRGQKAAPLSEIASGGELSRVMLAIKSATFDNFDVDTFIFDEIDAGVSGRAAQKIAEKLHKVSKSRQVLCVTHLPQIAAMADSQFLIEKHEDNNETVTAASLLEKEGRIEEIARIIGGAEITEQTKIGARDLIEQCENYKKGDSNADLRQGY